jgi:hypothetical protein
MLTRNLFAALLCLLPALGCTKKKTFPVEVVHGFTGYVHIFCGPAVGFPSGPVHVNALGGADAQSCPGRDADVTVSRDGKSETPTAVSWERTSDGTPTGLSFNVK